MAEIRVSETDLPGRVAIHMDKTDAVNLFYSLPDSWNLSAADPPVQVALHVQLAGFLAR